MNLNAIRPSLPDALPALLLRSPGAPRRDDRDAEQSRLLHQPAWIVSTDDPITGRDASEIPGHPTLVDGNLTVHFESQDSLQEYLDMPINHPFPLVDDPVSEGYDEG